MKVAAQNIILAGSAIHEDFTVKPLNETVLKNFRLGKWPIWTRRFEQLTNIYNENNNTVLAAILKEAHGRIVSLSA